MMPGEKSKNIKMFGYLEKRGKWTLRGRWKRRWCVLEEYLLLYYKSHNEYLNLSPCCGSLNVKLVRKIQPNVGCLIHITTHSQVIVLRTQNKEKQVEWFHALVSILPQSIPDGLQYNDSLFPREQTHRKSQKRRRETRSKSLENENCITKTKLIEEQNNCCSEYEENNGVEQEEKFENTNLHNVSYTSPNFSIHRCLSEGNIKETSISSDVKEFRRSFPYECTSLPRKINTNQLNTDNWVLYEKRNRLKSIDTKPKELVFEKNVESVAKRIKKKRNRRISVHRPSLRFVIMILSNRKNTLVGTQAQKEQCHLQELEYPEDSSLTNVLPTEYTAEASAQTSNSIESSETDIRTSIDSDATVEQISVCTEITNGSVMIEERRSWKMTECKPNIVIDEPPDLPEKRRINIQLRTNSEQKMFNPNTMLDDLLSQLDNLNKPSNFLSVPTQPGKDKVPDYDIPRPHLSVDSETNSNDTDTTRQNSPSYNYDEDQQSFGMAPDSLEMPWLSNDRKKVISYWPVASDDYDDYYCLQSDIESDNDNDFLDSLNPIKLPS